MRYKPLKISDLKKNIFDRYAVVGIESGLEEGELGIEEAEGEAVVRGGSEAVDGGAVGFCGVAFVYVPTVVGILGVDFDHVVVAVGFGKD